MLRKLIGPAAALMLAACGQGSDNDAGSSGGQGSPAPGGGARAYVWSVGSSTVFPFASRVAENFAQKAGGAAPRVESLGTGGGIKLFCSGAGSNTPDIANASRPMKASEFEQCQANGVRDIVEIKIGYDGVVIAGARNGADYDLQLADVYRAVAAQSPGANGAFVANPNTTWKQVNPALPDVRIEVYGPPPTSGTRDAFVELAMEGGAKQVPALAALAKSDEKAFKQRTGTLREDGRWIDSGENDNAIVQTLTRTPGALGVFGYSFLQENRDRVKAARIAGVAPSEETVADGSYPLSRSLFIYVKKAHLDSVPGLRGFVSEFVSDAAAGRGGYLGGRGLIPLKPEELTAVRQAASAMTPMQKPAK